MLFNSFIFWAFLLGVLVLYWPLRRRAQNALLLAASYVFYGAWDWRFLFLVLFSTLADYSIARLIGRSGAPRRRRALITLAVTLQLALLGFFKYYNFFSHELATLLTHLGLPLALPALRVILPVGISFYTFQSMSYTIDVYRRRSAPVTDLLDFAAYVCFFPQLVAGPIERAQHLMPQFQNERTLRAEDWVEGLYHILFGLFKKVVIADNLAPLVNTIFARQAGGTVLSGGECWVAVYAFTLQIYGDFSGYSSIAKGVAKLLGFTLMDNFSLPYFARTPSEFWQRWHISLSRWLRDYLYITLGGNRRGPWRTGRNLMLTMILGGLWHGANWTFIAWGFYHGVLLCLYRLFAPQSRAEAPAVTPEAHGPLRTLGRGLMVLLMFHLAALGWLLFRADSLAQAWAMAVRMASDPHMSSLAWSGLGLIGFFAGPLMIYEAWLERAGDPLRLLRGPWFLRGLAYGYAASMLILFTPLVSSEFIYFQF